MTLLTNEFIAQYRNVKPPFNQLGEFVYYRTYSRWLPDMNRRETWLETCRRSVEYNCSLAKTTTEEAQQLFDNQFNLRQFLSGRTLWVGGTEVAQKYPMSNFNCSFIVMDELEAFEDLFYLLMIGTGVGFRVLKRDVDKLPTFRTDVHVVHKPYDPVPKPLRCDHSQLRFEYNNSAIINVGDSKEGWVQALRLYFELLTHKDYRQIEKITFVYDHVRPKGERLKTFGGTASGHESLRQMFIKIDATLKGKFAPIYKGRLRPIHVLDICNIIGENVVVGGVRRTAEIALLDADDSETLYAKHDLTNPELYHRFMSNNSIFYETKPTREQIALQFEVLQNAGEPCFVNAEAAHKRRPNFEGVNPCVEILLDNRGLCNLTTVNVLAFVHDRQLDLDGLLQAQRLSGRAGYRMTNVTLELYKWDRIQKRDRLTGCSVTGWKDAMEALGYTREQEAELEKLLHDTARNAADEYADELKLPRPLLVTAVKPEGTISQVAGGVSSGLHHAHSPYYIRRIRINAHDPLVKVVEDLGWKIHNEVGQGIAVKDDNGAPYITPVTTKVIDFPVHSPVGRTKYDVSAIEQLQTYYSFQRNYTEHNSSNTISVKDDEWDGVEEYIWNNWGEMVAVSFLKLDGHVYDLAPYEAISQEQYENLTSQMQPFDSYLLGKYETVEQELDIGMDGCESGACPIR